MWGCYPPCTADADGASRGARAPGEQSATLSPGSYCFGSLLYLPFPLHSLTLLGFFFPHLPKQMNQLLLRSQWHVRAV